MRRVTVVAVLSLLSMMCVSVSKGEAQNARQRQAAAQAYDRGTTAYVDQAYEEAARWFETANRLAPAAPALMQAIRAYERNENLARAATLALELQTTYREDGTAKSFAQSILDKNAAALLRVQVSCDDDCKLDVDGKLEEHLTFFVAPQNPHQLVATFETGSQSAEVRGAAGEVKDVSFTAPPASEKAPLANSDFGDVTQPKRSRPPLSPVVTWIGIGVTAALGAATIISGIDTLNGKPKYERAAEALKNCKATPGKVCAAEETKATGMLEDGQKRETRTNILIGVTAAAAVGTSVLAIVLTDWSGDEERGHSTTAHAPRRSPWLASARVRFEPRIGGAATVLEGRF